METTETLTNQDEVVRRTRKKFKLEPRISGEVADKVIKQLRFDEFAKVDAVGFSGGIWVLWKKSIGTVQVLAKESQILIVVITGATAFLEVFSVRNLVDLGAQGPKFTWSNKHKDGSLILKRLDRALCNLEWRHLFPDAMVRNLARIKKSDHCPVLLQISKGGFRNAICRPFRFEAAWLTHDSFSSFIEERWRKDESLHENLKAFTPAIKEWNTSVFGNNFTRKKKLLARLEGVQRNLETRPNKFLYKLENELLVEYNEVLMQEELLWFQKSRSQ
ncbi:hypothetical protein REPUB_Repub16aG0133600 [Reevesia pubescens]